ncbi:TetR/AcrR family transcriptional regulator [Nocardioides sp. NPDC023903]|uniref:TetR/AcrR family transcriptional regulator n=1 Tax=Nocardioides sp. NPDC023903 TaxID=3157195 RepID=UPI0033DF3D8B
MVRQATVTESPRSKRGLILSAAVESFGDDGFELTKWASVADKVGIGQTALYHYFESKVHCLLTIMSTELERSASRFERVVSDEDAPIDQLRAAVRAAYDVTPQEVLQMRILQSHMDLLATPRQSEREEAERQHARELVRKVEENWTGLVKRGIESGDFADRDPEQTSRAVLALLVSVWRWYRTGGPTTLEETRDFISDAVLRLVGP